MVDLTLLVESGQLKEFGRLGELVWSDDSSQSGKSGQAEVGECTLVKGRPLQMMAPESVQALSTAHRCQTDCPETSQTVGSRRVGGRANRLQTPFGSPRTKVGQQKMVQTQSMPDRHCSKGWAEEVVRTKERKSERGRGGGIAVADSSSGGGWGSAHKHKPA